ncbi:hypothetical protein [Dietzia sp.]|uniref:hypothetical protein n=1 Tax=Dietzia sp. TaxID=1871616 RepID=UPI002FDADD11
MTSRDPSPGRAQKGDPPLYERIAPRVADLAGRGESRAAIARALDCAPSTVGRAAKLAGVSFDTTPTEAATAVAVARTTASRADLAERSAGLADQAGRRLALELGAEVLDPAAVRSLATVYGIAVDKLLALAATLPDSAEASSKGALDSLMAAIIAAADPNK